jgi:hypothetical protein
MKDIGTNTNPQLPKGEFYKDLAEQISAITEDQSYWVGGIGTALIVQTNLCILFFVGDQSIECVSSDLP